MPMAPKSTQVTTPVDNADLQKGVTDPRERRIQRSGIWQAVASNPALVGYAADIESLHKVVEELAEAGLRWVNNV